MPRSDGSHALIEWIKVRLDEMDHGIAEMEARIRQVSITTVAQARLALFDARTWRDFFADQTIDALNQPVQDLEHAWNQFERAVERWNAAAGDSLELLKARAESQAATWLVTAEHFRSEVERATLAQRASIDAEIAVFSEAAHSYRQRLNALQATSLWPYAALSNALRQSREAFDSMTAKVRQQFSVALHG